MGESIEAHKHLKYGFLTRVLPVFFLALIILYGLVLKPHYFDEPAIPLEIIFLLAGIFSITQLLILGYPWKQIQAAAIDKLAKGFPAILILFAIGVIIGSWIISGTIPMLIYYGIKIIDPSYLYLLSFVVPALFAILTGTSWGSVGTIGAVLIGIANVVEADLGITAGAIIGGAYFGDKMSPLSDTTNLASVAVEVDLYEHIGSMLYTTLPSAILASIIFFVMGFIYPPNAVSGTENGHIILGEISELFHFNILLLLPPLIILAGSLKKYPALPTLLLSAVTAGILALLFQDYGLTDVFNTFHTGFKSDMALWVGNPSPSIELLFDRGGLYQLNEAIVFTIMALVFIGSLDLLKPMPLLVDKVFGTVKKRSSVIISSLIASAFTNAITSSQSAVSFIIGDAFKPKYQKLKIPLKVLSRSIEDYGTMIESLVPWTATVLFMTATLGVSFADYWHWQLVSLINLIVAPTLAILGIGCFYGKKKEKQHQNEENQV